jgi:hypothetical protein
MSFPDPTQQLDAFIAYLRAESLDFCVHIVEMSQNIPGDLSDERLDEANLSNWCDRMYGFLVCIIHYSLSQADRPTIFIGETYSDPLLPAWTPGPVQRPL